MHFFPIEASSDDSLDAGDCLPMHIIMICIVIRLNNP
jgi:hypothetical protein